MNTKQMQQGFTLIELVVVIVILGILAATALPRFVDLSVESHNAAAAGVAGAIASGTAINLGARRAGNATAVVLNDADVCTSAILQPFVNGVNLTAGAPVGNNDFQIQQVGGAAGDCSGANVTVRCQVLPSGTNVTAQPVTVTCAR